MHICPCLDTRRCITVTVIKVLAVFAVCDWWRYCKALCDVQFLSYRGKWWSHTVELSKSVITHQFNFLTMSNMNGLNRNVPGALQTLSLLICWTNVLSNVWERTGPNGRIVSSPSIRRPVNGSLYHIMQHVCPLRAPNSYCGWTVSFVSTLCVCAIPPGRYGEISTAEWRAIAWWDWTWKLVFSSSRQWSAIFSPTTKPSPPSPPVKPYMVRMEYTIIIIDWSLLLGHCLILKIGHGSYVYIL